MINVIRKDQCCGCSACEQICPKSCITFSEDSEGFFYPSVDVIKCIDCGLCEKICPVINQDTERNPTKVYAAKHKDDRIRMKSSSGGVFTCLAEQILEQGGVVFGAKFNDIWDVVHDYAETKEDLVQFRGSKYVQSRLGDTFSKVESFLKLGRKVMFTGTPCQVAGLKKYLRKEYDNLLAVDFVCHGVPSPKIWRMYLQEITNFKGTLDNGTGLTTDKVDCIIKGVNFRDKSQGWKNFSFVLDASKISAVGEEDLVLSTIFYENPYLKAFLDNLSLRPSCYACPARSGKSGSDITMGDFWGVENVLPDEDDNKGVSLVLAYSGPIMFLNNLDLVESLYEDAIKGNICISQSVAIPVNRAFFFSSLERKGFCESYAASVSPQLYSRIKRMLFRKFSNKVK